ncbi:MAG TPA: hypothetical protein VGL70_09575 [Candidatus Binatia bacterium]
MPRGLTLRTNAGIIRAVREIRCGRITLIIIFVSSCSAAITPAQREESQNKFAEYQLARSVVARSQTCLETLLPELRAIMDGKDGMESEQEFAAKWGLKRFDPNTGFDDAWAACVGEPTLKDLGIRDEETAIKFLERKRSEWVRAQRAAGGSVVE